jgi:uncharacterized integral membrane protein
MSVTRWAEPRPPRHLNGSGLFLRYWVFWVALGQAVGVLVPAGAVLVFGGAPVRAPVVILAGAVQGALIGWTQATVLRVRVPALSRLRWVRATAIGGAAAWFIGLLPAEWADIWQGWPNGGQVVGGTVLAALVLVAPGVAQWTELRRHARSAGWWIPGNAAAGAIGLLLGAAVAALVWQPGRPAVLIVLAGVLAGILTAVTIALGSGGILLGILRSRNHRQAT